MIGTNIGSYHILETMGQQESATTYKARDMKMDRLVMVKAVDLPEDDADALASFRKEARAGAVLNHPNIATIYDVVDSPQGRFLVYEYIAGLTLAERIARGASTGDLIPIEQGLEYVVDIARGLAEAHRHGIIHRDISAQSVIVTPTHVVKITNFGKARLTSAPTFAGSLTLLTSCGFISPERLQGKDTDHRGDIYSLSALMFEVLTGEKPYTAKGAAALLQEILYNPVPDMVSLRPGIPPEVQRIVDKGMAKDPAERYQSIDAMLEDLTSTLRLGVPEDLALPDEPAIAVLPFQCIGNNPELAEFAQGAVEEIVCRLQSLKGLRVASSTSAARLKGVTEDLRKVGAHLGVNLILEGNLRAAGPRVRLIVKLTAADTGYQIWSQRLERELTDPFELQDEIAGLIAAKLEAHVRGEDLEMAEAAPVVPDATPSGQFLAARGTLAPPVATGPEQLPAVDLAAVLAAAEGRAAPNEVLPAARKAAAKVLAADPPLADAMRQDALVVLGYSLAILEGPSAESEDFFRRALASDPLRMDALTGLAKFVLAARGNFAEAIGVLEPADSKAAPSELAKGWILFWQHRYEDAMQQSRTALRLDPQSPEVYLLLGKVCAAMGQYKEAIVALGRGRLIAPNDSRHLAALSYCYGKSGQTDEANRLAEELGGLARHGYVSVLDIALPYAGIGQSEWVECCLDRVAAELPAARLWFAYDPEWDGYRKDAASAGRS